MSNFQYGILKFLIKRNLERSLYLYALLDYHFQEADPDRQQDLTKEIRRIQKSFSVKT